MYDALNHYKQSTGYTPLSANRNVICTPWFTTTEFFFFSLNDFIGHCSVDSKNWCHSIHFSFRATLGVFIILGNSTIVFLLAWLTNSFVVTSQSHWTTRPDGWPPQFQISCCFHDQITQVVISLFMNLTGKVHVSVTLASLYVLWVLWVC